MYFSCFFTLLSAFSSRGCAFDFLLHTTNALWLVPMLELLCFLASPSPTLSSLISVAEDRMLVLETGAFALRSQSLSFITPHNSFTSSFNASTSLNSARFFDVKQKQHTKSLFSSKSTFSLNHIHRKWNQPEHSSQHTISPDSRSLPQRHRTFSTLAHSPLPSTRQPLDVAVSATFTSMTSFCASSVESDCGPVLI